MILPEVLGEDFMDEVVRVVLIHFDFFKNHSPFAANVLNIENRIQHQVAEHVECYGKMLVEHLDVEADALLGGEGIHIAPDGVHLAGDLLGRSVLRALEDHVLDEMRNAIPMGVFVPRTGFYPYPNGDGADMLHLLRDDGEPVGQDFAMYVAELFDHKLSPTRPGKQACLVDRTIVTHEQEP